MAAVEPAGFWPIEIRVIGHPQPEGNKRPVRNRATGGIVLIEGRTAEATARVQTWRDAVAWTARAWAASHGHPAPITDPVRVDALFLLPKPPSRPKRERLAMTGFDRDKLERALHDALSKDSGLIADDKRVIMGSIAKLWAMDTAPGVIVRIDRLVQEDWSLAPLAYLAWPDLPRVEPRG